MLLDIQFVAKVEHHQKLRDVTTQTDPFDTTWPTQPE